MNMDSQSQSSRVFMPVICMLLAVMTSAMAVIYSKHAGRAEFVVLQKLEQKRDLLNEEWGRLLLEKSTWASPSRVEKDAVTRLNMIVPTAEITRVVTP